MREGVRETASSDALLHNVLKTQLSPAIPAHPAYMKSPWLPGGGSTDIHSNIKPGCWVSIQNKIVMSTGSFSAFFTDLKSSQHFTSCCIDVQK